MGEMHVKLLLDLVDPLEEAPGGQRDHDADEGDDDQQHGVASAANRCVGLPGGGRFGAHSIRTADSPRDA